MANIAIINTNNTKLVEGLKIANALILDCRWAKSNEDPERNRLYPETLSKNFGKKYRHATKLSPRFGEQPSEWLTRCEPAINRIVSLAREGYHVVLLHYNTKLLKLFAHHFGEMGQRTVFFYEFPGGKSGECLVKQLTKEQLKSYFDDLFPSSLFSADRAKTKKKDLDAEAVFGDIL